MNEFLFHGKPTQKLKVFFENLKETLINQGFAFNPQSSSPKLVLNAITPESPTPYRRRAQATFVVTAMELPSFPENPIHSLYHYLVRALSNMLMVYVPDEGVKFLTLELGHYDEPEMDGFYQRVVNRIIPLASSRLIIRNIFESDLEPELWQGDELTESMYTIGKKLKEWDLLPALFPIEEILPPKDFQHVKKLYGIGGLSYGNLSIRRDEKRFWMSASGVDKANLKEIGRDILMVKDYDAEKEAIVLSVPPNVEPRRVSVDAIEHWMIYQEHPNIGAILHVHAWMDGIPATSFNYPCGTYELAKEVTDRIRETTDPCKAVVGLKNHGLTITGKSLTEIVERIEGKLIRTVPMT
jgi:ribulose-5-phosphate 4-epimerase/fuculose-1-phosphate aldolase